MKAHRLLPLLLLLLAACARRETPSSMTTPVLITDPSQLKDHVGQLVTLQGEVHNSKIPELLGVDIQSDSPDLRGKRATATGILKREVVKAKDVDPYSASRGAGTYYQLVDEKTGMLVQVQPL